MKTFLAPLAGASLIVLAPAAASAQPAPVAQAPDPAKLAEAHAIIDIMFPPAQRNKMMDDMITNLSGPIQKSLSVETITDPGLKKLMANFMDEMLAQERPILQKHMPQLLDAMAVAFTHEFSVAELKDIGTFAATPAGTHYFSHAMGMLGDPAVAKASLDIGADAQAMTKAMVAGFKDKVIAYLKAHPEVAKQLEAENKGS